MNQDYPEPRQYIDGEWIRGSGKGIRQIVNPANNTVIGELREAAVEDLDRALEAAQKGFELWRATAPIQRAGILQRAAQLLRERNDEITRLACLEEGQPFEEGKSYVLRGAEVIEWDAAEGRRVYGRIIPSDPGMKVLATREPIGVVAAFTPWNAPVFTPCRKLGSVLAAGCGLIIKGAEETPASTAALVRVFVDAGVPPGVINLVYGNPEMISSYLIRSPIVRLVTFTGSVNVGKRLASMAAAEMKPSVMELGGHAPVIVCEDADIDDAAAKLAFVKYRNAGQACLCPSRFWVADAVYDRFVELFATYARRLKVGPAFEPDTRMGPLANCRRLEAVRSLVDDAVAHGATIHTGGKRIGSEGCFFEPTVLGDVPYTARIHREEPFGPVAVINRFSDLEAVLRQANALPLGLAAYVFTRSSKIADWLADRLQCGTVGINHMTVSTSGVPFGGVKDSGFGREGGIEGVAGYTVIKTVSHLYL